MRCWPIRRSSTPPRTTPGSCSSSPSMPWPTSPIASAAPRPSPPGWRPSTAITWAKASSRIPAMTSEATVLDSAFELRRRHFPDEMHFHAPGIKRYETDEFQQRQPQAFVPLSVTGSHCALDCDHCGKQILRHMRSVADGDLFALCERLAANGTQGLLISGGCDSAGRVPLAPWLPAMRRVREELGLRLIVHSGLVDEPLAAGLAEAGVESAMIDIIGADHTIRQVYHLGRGVEHYEESLRLLAAYGVPALPHIIVGPHYGRLPGERNALAMVKRHSPAGLIVVVLTPLAQTRMADVVPPAVGPVLDFLATRLNSSHLGLSY